MDQEHLRTADLLDRSAEKWPDRVALDFESASWTYRELAAWVDAVAGGLAAQGISGRVALISENCPEYLIVQLALLRLGLPIATPNPAWTATELRKTLDPLNVGTVIGESRFASQAPTFIDIGRLPQEGQAPPHVPARGSDEAFLPFSSGTTGLPKAVRHTHASLSGAMEQLIHHLALTGSDHVQLSLPLCHIFGTTVTGAALRAGARITLFRRFDLDQALEHANRANVTVMPLAGTTAYRLSKRNDLGPLPSLRFFLWGGGPVPQEPASVITGKTGVGFLTSYGMTEAMVVAFNPVNDRENWSLDSPGFSALGMHVRCNSQGELEVRGASVAAGYVGLDEGWTSDGWFRTGDVGSIQPDGRLLITDRAKDMLKVAGFAVSPTEIEMALLELDGVNECGVFGEADEVAGQVPVAVVVGEVAISNLELWAEQRLARYKRPRRYVLTEALPRTAGGKLQRRRLPAEAIQATSKD